MLSWDRIQSVYEPTAERHARTAQLVGLRCPLPVFAALFHDRGEDPALGRLLGDVDLLPLEWALELRSGQELRDVLVDRDFQPAVDAAHRELLQAPAVHARDEVADSWLEYGSWKEPPILMAGEVLGSSTADVLLVGSTRLGQLEALLDCGLLPPTTAHQVWVGRTRIPPGIDHPRQPRDKLDGMLALSRSFWSFYRTSLGGGGLGV
jgi:hypothetical protein